jgi:hypothetical protein
MELFPVRNPDKVFSTGMAHKKSSWNLIGQGNTISFIIKRV